MFTIHSIHMKNSQFSFSIDVDCLSFFHGKINFKEILIFLLIFSSYHQRKKNYAFALMCSKKACVFVYAMFFLNSIFFIREWWAYHVFFFKSFLCSASRYRKLSAEENIFHIVENILRTLNKKSMLFSKRRPKSQRSIDLLFKSLIWNN